MAPQPVPSTTTRVLRGWSPPPVEAAPAPGPAWHSAGPPLPLLLYSWAAPAAPSPSPAAAAAQRSLEAEAAVAAMRPAAALKAAPRAAAAVAVPGPPAAQAAPGPVGAPRAGASRPRRGSALQAARMAAAEMHQGPLHVATLLGQPEASRLLDGPRPKAGSDHGGGCSAPCTVVPTLDNPAPTLLLCVVPQMGVFSE